MSDRTAPLERARAESRRDLVGHMHALMTCQTQDFLGGPRHLKMVWVINF